MVAYPYHLLAEMLDSFLTNSVISNENKNKGQFSGSTIIN